MQPHCKPSRPWPRLNRELCLLVAGLTLTGLLLTSSTDLLSATSAPAPKPAEQAPNCAWSPEQSTTLEGAELGDELEFLSWNIQKASSRTWANDLSQFADGVHLAFIQEAALDAGIESMLTTANKPFFAQGYSSGKLKTGVMTLSSELPSLGCSLTAMEPWLGTPKATNITQYALRGRSESLLAINLHAVNFTVGVEEFREQFHALQDLLTRHKGPIIVAGDFNTWSAERENLVDAFLQQHGLGAIEFMPDLRTRAFGRALDHIYVRGLESEAARVIPVESSDHNALRVTLRIPQVQIP
jgi:endonuclease/exonuclease/phosphatase (EEP) superfamily protein YafD